MPLLGFSWMNEIEEDRNDVEHQERRAERWVILYQLDNADLETPFGSD